MLGKDGIWQVLAPEVERLGFQLFDIQVPGGRGQGILRVFIQRPGGGSVTIDDCSRIASDLSGHPQANDFLPGDTLLEVSSPGVNRRLSRPEHFSGAIGERVRLTVSEMDGKKHVVRGLLQAVEAGQLQLQNEETNAVERFALSAVSEARVDFLFA